jgi:hypothetical protein
MYAYLYSYILDTILTMNSPRIYCLKRYTSTTQEKSQGSKLNNFSTCIKVDLGRRNI